MAFIRIFVLFLFAHCSKENTCVNEIVPDGLPIKVEGPATATAGTTITKQITFKVHNGCGQFAQFSENNSGQNRIISIFASYPTCQICTQDLPTRKADYTFTPETSGTYILTFTGPYNAQLLDTVTVN